MNQIIINYIYLKIIFNIQKKIFQKVEQNFLSAKKVKNLFYMGDLIQLKNLKFGNLIQIKKHGIK